MIGIGQPGSVAALALILAAAESAAAPAQAGATLRFRHLDSVDGLNQNTVISLLQDRRGFVWIGTEDGLHRYDGYGFELYRHRPDDPASLSGNYVNALHEGSDGTLWVATGASGLSLFDTSTGTARSFRADPDRAGALRHNRVWSVAEDGLGRLWVATDAGLDRLGDDGLFRPYVHDPEDPDSLASNLVRSLATDRRGRLWIGTFGGLNYLDPLEDAIRRYDLDTAEPMRVTALHEDREGNLWLALDGVVARLDPQRNGLVRIPNEDPSRDNDSVNRIHRDARGNVWATTDGGGLRRLRPGADRFIVYRHDPSDPDSIGDDYGSAILEDRSGLLWFGTGVAGVATLHPGNEVFTHYRRHGSDPARLPGNTVWSFYEDDDDTVWVATDKGLARLDRRTGLFRRYDMEPADDGASYEEVYFVLRDRRGTLWVGARAGLYRHDEAADRFVFENVYGDGESLDYIGTVHVIHESRDGSLWLGGFNGLVRRDAASGATRRFGSDDADSWVNAFAETVEGELWVGTEGGLKRLASGDGAVLDHYRNDPGDPDSISNDAVQALLASSAGELWVGTASGLNRLDPAGRRFRRYDVEDGLPSNYVYGLLEDDAGRIWLSTNRGLARLDAATGEVVAFDVSDGLQGNEFNTGAAHRGASGHLYFGGINGFNVFDPGELDMQPVAPRPGITSIRVRSDDGERDVAPDGAPITLGHRDTVLTIEFSAFDYKAPEQNRYSFLLEGFDGDWRPPAAERRATYTSLDPGRYRFRLRAGNSDGIWAEAALPLSLRVMAPPWRRWYAWTAYAIAAAFAFWGSLRVWGERVRREQLLRDEHYRRTIAERLREFAGSLASVLDGALIAERLLDATGGLIRFDAAAVYLHEAGGPRRLARQGGQRLIEHLDEAAQAWQDELAPAGSIGALDGDGPGARTQIGEKLLRAPFRYRDQTGVLLLGRDGNGPFDERDGRLAGLLANQASAAFHNARLFSEVQRLAVTDDLTGLYNRRHFDEVAAGEFERSIRYGAPLALMMIDVDRFKTINDTLGHQAGDRIIREIAGLCARHTRNSDVVARYGGDELIVLLPQTEAPVAAAVAQRIREEINLWTDPGIGLPEPLSISIGLAFRSEATPELALLIEAADMALQAAKREGRNCVVSAGEQAVGFVEN